MSCLTEHFSCDKELLESLNNIYSQHRAKFANKSHMIRQFIIRGIDDFYEKEKTFDKFVSEVLIGKK